MGFKKGKLAAPKNPTPLKLIITGKDKVNFFFSLFSASGLGELSCLPKTSPVKSSFSFSFSGLGEGEGLNDGEGESKGEELGKGEGNNYVGKDLLRDSILEFEAQNSKVDS